MYQDIAQIAVKETADEDLALVQATRNGDTAAFEELIKRYDRKLLHIALNVTRNSEDAEEAVQDTFLKAYRNLNRFEGKAKFATWLTRIAINESLTKLRKQHGNKETSLSGIFDWMEKSSRLTWLIGLLTPRSAMVSRSSGTY